MKLAIFGASGLAREVMDVAEATGVREIAFVDSTPAVSQIHGTPVVGTAAVGDLVDRGFRFVIGIGSNAIRKRVVGEFSGLPWCSVVHPGAHFGRGQRDALDRCRGAVVMAGVSFTNNIAVGDFCVFNPNVTIAHDCIIEDFVYVAPGANVSGNVHLAEGCYVGTGASFIHGKGLEQKLRVGAWSVVGVGAAVVRDVPDGVTVAGVPAKPLLK